MSEQNPFDQFERGIYFWFDLSKMAAVSFNDKPFIAISDCSIEGKSWWMASDEGANEWFPMTDEQCEWLEEAYPGINIEYHYFDNDGYPCIPELDKEIFNKLF